MDLPAIFKTILAKSLARTLVDGQTILPYHWHARPRTDNPQPQCIPMTMQIDADAGPWQPQAPLLQ